MNREFKFRFWKTETKEWVDFPSRGLSSRKALIESVYTDSDYFIIQQFTGVKDVDGKDIYEGDILEILESNMGVFLCGHPRYTAGKVTWVNESFQICQSGFGMEHLSEYLECHCHNAKIKIIGNIFERQQDSTL